MAFQQVPFSQLRPDFVRSLREDWMLVTAGTPERLGTMTVSWGFCGFVWDMDAVLVLIRASRNTLPYLLENPRFTLASFPAEYRDKLYYCGRHSGRDVDKAAVCGFTAVEEADLPGAPYFSQAEKVYICRKLYVGDIHEAGFADASPSPVFHQWYELGEHAGDMHRLFVAQVESALVKS